MGVEEYIVPGKILNLAVSFPHETKINNKYFVVACNEDILLLLKLNSNKEQPKIAKRFQERQFRLLKKDYPFLDHDSYLDCGTVWFNLLSIDEMISQVEKDPSRLVGDISEPHKNEIIRLTGMSKSIESRHKRKIAENLRSK